MAAVDALVGGGIMPVSEGRGPAEDEAGAPGADSPPPGEIEFDRTGSISFKNSDADNSPLSAEIDVVPAEVSTPPACVSIPPPCPLKGGGTPCPQARPCPRGAA